MKLIYIYIFLSIHIDNYWNKYVHPWKEVPLFDQLMVVFKAFVNTMALVFFPYYSMHGGDLVLLGLKFLFYPFLDWSNNQKSFFKKVLVILCDIFVERYSLMPI